MKCLVTGRVQGVWFRSGARQRAVALEITGHARNLPDGRVEVFACGREEDLAQLKAWLWRGTAAAAVSDVTCEPAAGPPPTGFVTG